MKTSIPSTRLPILKLLPNSIPRSLVVMTSCFVFTLGCSDRKDPAEIAFNSSPSEDVSHLLMTPESASGEFDFDAPRDYLPDPNIDWTVTVEFDGSAPVGGESINELLDFAWLDSNGRPTVYGFSPDTGHWTFVNAADAPDSFTSLKVAWSLWNAIDEKPRDISLDDLERFKSAAEEQLVALGRLNTKIERRGEDALAYVGDPCPNRRRV